MRELREMGGFSLQKNKSLFHFHVQHFEKKGEFLREAKKKPREELGRENPSVFAVESLN